MGEGRGEAHNKCTNGAGDFHLGVEGSLFSLFFIKDFAIIKFGLKGERRTFL
jgi:hypothetical protein